MRFVFSRYRNLFHLTPYQHSLCQLISSIDKKHQKLQQTSPLKDIAAAIKVSGISKIDLAMEEVKLIVDTLVYDGQLEEVRGAASMFNREVSTIEPLTRGEFPLFTPTPDPQPRSFDRRSRCIVLYG